MQNYGHGSSVLSVLSKGTSEMIIKKQTKVTTSNTALAVFLGSVAGMVVGIGFGPIAGLLAMLAGIVIGVIGSKKEAEKEADKLIPDNISDVELYDAMSSGKRTFTVKTELKNIHPGIPLHSRLMFGDKLTKKTTYYLDE